MINTDRLKKTVLDFFFQPFDVSAPYLRPDEVLHLGEDPALFDPARNAPPQQGDPAVQIYHDATIWPAQSVARRGQSLGFDTFIDEARIQHVDNLNALRHYPCIRHRGWATTIDSVYPTQNYYHFLVDALPRVWGLRHPKLRELEITLFLARPLKPVKKEILHSLLPPNVSVQRINRFSQVHADHYIHLPYLSKDRVAYSENRVETSVGFLPQAYIDYFRRFMLERDGDSSMPSGTERIYVTRRGASMRRLKNEVAVAEYLESRGFQTVALEEYTLEEQARLFSTARAVVAQHGAALANLIYMSKGSVVEIFSSPDTPQYYSQYADTMGLDYTAITLDRTWKNADVHLPIAKLDGAFNRIGLTGPLGQEVGGTFAESTE